MFEEVDKVVDEWLKDNQDDFSQCGVEIYGVHIDDVEELKDLIVKTVLKCME